ncbi:class I tRNA ligase family protein [Bacillus licheniformis]|nr:class I tRNA ligase family protein [Bacillus licheniformis]
MEHIVAVHPLYGRDSLVMLGEHVTTDAGTGCVHTAPGHGEDDFIIGQNTGLTCFVRLMKRTYDERSPGLKDCLRSGQQADYRTARRKGALLKLDFITHSYPHDWRTKNRLFSVQPPNGSLPSKTLEASFLKRLKKLNGCLNGARHASTI